MSNEIETQKTITIFNCWQSDLCSSTHRNAIRNALHKAKENLVKIFPEINIEIDEALRGSSGAPNIPENVRQKIEKSDIVVADITTVTPTGAERPCPNPNVTFELGFGVATVGWSRTLLLFNGEPQKGELPFDFAQNRVTKFSMTKKSDKSERDALEKLLQKAIRDIIEQDPKRPAEERGLSRHKIERQRDLGTARWLMEHLYVPAVSRTVEMLPRQILNKDFWFYHHFLLVADSTMFHLYDKQLAMAVKKLRDAWGRALSEGEAYTDMPNGIGYVFDHKLAGGFGGEGQRCWKRIENAISDMDIALEKLLSCIRNDFIEIDIEATSNSALKAYQDDMKF